MPPLRPRVLFGLLLTLASLPMGLLRAQAGPLFNPATGHWYEAVDVPGGITWPAARAAAEGRVYQGRPGYLATLTTAEENLWARGNFPLAVAGQYMLGGSQAPASTEPAGGWEWISGESWDYTRWEPGDPNNGGGFDQYLCFKASGRWQDASATDATLGYIVEYGTTPPIIPPISFTSPVSLPIYRPGDLQSFDLDQDGHADIAVASNNDIALLYGRGDGSFEGPYYQGLGRSVYDITAADVDGDGDLDIVLAADDSVWVMRRLLPRTYALADRYAIAGAVITGLAVGDLNGDARPEIACSAETFHSMSVFPNLGNGTFGARTNYGVGSFPSRVICTDLNNDGRRDLAVANVVSSTVSVFLGNGAGGLIGRGTVNTNGQYPTDLAVIDYDRDGVLDLVTGNVFGHRVATMRGHGNGDFDGGLTYPAGPYPHIVSCIDLDCDGERDILTSNNAAFYFSVFRIRNGSVGPQLDITTGGENCRTEAVADFNEDGRTDVVVGCENTNQLFLLLNKTLIEAPLPPTGIVSWWRGQGNADDATARNHGQPVGVGFAGGVLGQALSFDGIDDGVNLADSESLQLSPSLSITGWFNASSLPAPGKQRILVMRGDNRPGLDPYSLGLDSDGRLCASVTSLMASVTLKAPPVRLAEWHHFAVTLNDATGLFQIYVDGLPAAQITTAVRPLRDLDTTAQPGCGIGNVQASPNASFNQPFHGLLDEVQVHRRALTDSEINNQVLSVPLPPSSPDNLIATPVSTSEIQLTWQDKSWNESGFEVELATGGGSFTPVTTTSPNVTDFLVGGLLEDTTYSLRVRAVNAIGPSNYVGPATVATLPSIPTAPDGFTASTVDTRIELSWQDRSSNEEGFTLERKVESGSFAALATVGANVDRFDDSSPPADSLVTYRVRSFNRGGSSTWSATASELSPPAAPTELATSAIGSSAVTVTWVDRSGTETAFSIERRTGAGAFALLESVAADVTTYESTGMSPNTVYEFRVRATRGTARSTYSNTASPLTLPSTPVGLSATVISQTRINLSWTDTNPSPCGHRVEQAQGGDAWSEVAALPAGTNAYSAMGLVANTSYHFRVRAHNATGPSGYLGPASATTLPEPPAAPTGLTLLVRSQTRIDLAWGDASDNETGFRVERREGAQGWGTPAEVGAGTTTYEATDLTANTSYSFRVQAFNTGGPSAWAGAGPVNTLPNPPSAPDGLSAVLVGLNRIDLAWQDRSDNETGFEVERQVGGGAFGAFAGVGTGVTSLAVPDLALDTTYGFRVRAVNSGGVSSWTVPATATTAPVAPTDAAAAPADAMQLRLTWTDASSTETGFRIERRKGMDAFAEVGAVDADIPQWLDAGLTSNTTFEYRVRAVRGAVLSAYSNVAVGLTLPAAPGGLTAVVRSQTRVDLSWTDANPIPCSHRVEQAREGEGWTEVATTAAGATDYFATGLSANTLYRFRVRALNDAGASGFSGPVDATTWPMPPTAPTALTLLVRNQTRIDLSWTDASDNESGFRVERRAGTGDWGEGADLPADSTGMISSGLTSNTAYHFRVRAFNSGGVSEWTVAGPASTLPDPPGAPQNVTALLIAVDAVQVSWTDASNNETGFRVERATGMGEYSEVASLGAGATSYDDVGLLLDTSYSYRVRAFNSGGDVGVSSPVYVTTAPTPPDGLSVSEVGVDRLRLSWMDRSSTETGFSVERQTGAGGFTSSGTAPRDAVQLLVEGLASNTTYALRVRAVRNAVESTASTATGALTLPGTPSGLVLTVVSSSQLDLNWTDGSAIPSGHRVERSSDGGVTYTELGTTPAGDNRFSDTGRASNTTYHYRVRAYNAAGAGAYSPSRSATTLPDPPGAPGLPTVGLVSPSAARLLWSAATGIVQGYRIERSLNGVAYSEIATTGAGVTSYEATGLQPDRRYYFRVRAYNSGGASPYSGAAAIDTPPAAPTGLALVVTVTPRITLLWDDVSSSETGFRIERRVGDGPFALLAETGAGIETYLDTSVVSNTNYAYRVRAYSGAGESAFSSTETALTPPAAASGLSVAAVSSTRLDVSWTDSNSPAAAHRLERSTVTPTNFVDLGLIPAGMNRFEDGGRTPNTTYWYRVRAVNAAGASVATGPVSGSTLPGAPSSLSVTPVSSSRLDLTWSAGAPVAHRVERADSGGDFSLIATTSAGVNTFVDSSCQANTAYGYRVSAVNAGGASGPSDVAGGLTFPAAPPTVDAIARSQSRLSIFWTDGNPIPASHLVERSAGGGAGWLQIAQTAPGVAAVEDEGLSPATVYYYRVRATNDTGLSVFSDTIAGATLPVPPAAPEGVSARAVSPTRVDVEWSDRSSNETGFELERRVGLKGAFQPLNVTNPGATLFSDGGIQAGVRYFYRVRAVNSGGASAWAGPVEAGVPIGGKLTVSPAKLAFGSRRAAQPPLRKAVVIRNAGRGTLSGRVGAVPAPYRVLEGGGAFSLEPRKTRKVVVEFAPTRSGSYPAGMEITSTDPAKSRLEILLTGQLR